MRDNFSRASIVKGAFAPDAATAPERTTMRAQSACFRMFFILAAHIGSLETGRSSYAPEPQRRLVRQQYCYDDLRQGKKRAFSPQLYTSQLPFSESMVRPYRGVMPKIASSAYIDLSAQIIGDVVIGERSSVWLNVSIRGDVNHIRIGDETSIQDNTVLHVDHDVYPCVIGNRVTVGHAAVLHGCVVEDGVLIGIGAIVLEWSENRSRRSSRSRRPGSRRHGSSREQPSDGRAGQGAAGCHTGGT